MMFINFIKASDLNNKNGITTINDSKSILERQRSHFENMLNEQANIRDDLLRIISQYHQSHPSLDGSTTLHEAWQIASLS